MALTQAQIDVAVRGDAILKQIQLARPDVDRELLLMQARVAAGVSPTQTLLDVLEEYRQLVIRAEPLPGSKTRDVRGDAKPPARYQRSSSRSIRAARWPSQCRPAVGGERTNAGQTTGSLPRGQ